VQPGFGTRKAADCIEDLCFDAARRISFLDDRAHGGHGSFDPIDRLDDDARATDVTASLVTDLGFDLVTEPESFDRCIEQGSVGARIDQRAERHVAGDA
jgi:hypothetical protein